MNGEIPGDFLPCAEWTDDCQGKKDYDGPLLSISTRYWPSTAEQAELAKTGLGFNFLNLTSGIGHFESLPYDKNGFASARAALVLNTGEPESGDYWTLVEAEFSAATGEEVRRQVEEWVKDQCNRIVTHLRGVL